MIELVKRLGPIVKTQSLRDNVNGPSVIRVPNWVENKLGKYYMYFAHHLGKYIRLAYSDKIEGPWKIYEPGTLRLDQTLCVDHIASPDVHVDNDRIIMYFHGKTIGLGQVTYVADSFDGLNFNYRPVATDPFDNDSTEIYKGDTPISSFYFRRFMIDDNYYGLSKKGNEGLQLLQWDGVSPYNPYLVKKRLILLGRHCTVHVSDKFVYVIYSAIGDCPERIVYNVYTRNFDIVSINHSLIRPEELYEGVNQPYIQSRPGSTLTNGINQLYAQLRDPYLFEDDGKMYLFYSIAGENGIAVAEIKINEKELE